MYRCEQRGFEELGQSLPLKLTMRGRVKDNRKTIPGTRQVRKTCPAHCPQTVTTQPARPVPGDRRCVRRGHLRVWGRGGEVGGSRGAGPRRGARGRRAMGGTGRAEQRRGQGAGRAAGKSLGGNGSGRAPGGRQRGAAPQRRRTGEKRGGDSHGEGRARAPQPPGGKGRGSNKAGVQ